MKIFAPRVLGFELEAWHSLSVTFGLLFAGIAVSLWKAKDEKSPEA